MEGARRPKKIFGGFDKRSSWILVAMFVVGVGLILVDAVLLAGLWKQSPGTGFLKWLSKPTPSTVPVIEVDPTEGMLGVKIAVVGQGWRAGEFLDIQLSDPSGVCPTALVATTSAGPEGRFRQELTFPADGCWAGLTHISVLVHSIETEAQATADFRVFAAPQTPTPTLTWTAVVEPTETPALTATPVPTATPWTEPTATPTQTPVVLPTATATPTVAWPTATPTVTIVNWRGEYFGNMDLMGTPLVVRDDTAINFDWQYNAPAMGLIPVDGFSARWTRALYFEDGFYRFQAVVDDGIRLYVDGDLVIDQWRDGGRREVTLDWRMKAGWHTVRVEYYERSGTAAVQVRWDKIVYYPDWKGEYWPNVNLQGNPAIVRNDPGPGGALGLDFNWRQGSPGSGIPVDGFSARWTRQVALDAGAYRFHALVDDGVRLWLNDRVIVDAWADHDTQEFAADWMLAQGVYTLKIEYYERVGDARIRVWWDKMVSPAFPEWKGEYWPNRTLSGDVALLRNDPEISFDWGPGAPSTGLPSDGFSVRWTRQAHFEAAAYRFHALADDGIRLWVDGQLLIDKWRDQHPAEFTADRTLTRGMHSVKVEYYEHTGGARVKVWWDQVPVSFSDWKGEYWSNRDLSGSPALVRNDKGPGDGLAIDFNWGTGAPAMGLPNDNLSVRWTRQVTLSPGLYRFSAWADDGVRVALDDRWIINEWHDARNEVYSVDQPLSGAPLRLKVEYYDRSGNAAVRFWWNRLGDLPTPAPAYRAQFSSAVYTVDEAAGTATITVLLSAASDRVVTVDYATLGGTAAPGSDYGALSGRLTFEPGSTSRSFAVSIVDDTVDEPDETVVLTLSNPVNAQLGAIYQSVLTLLDNDAPAPPSRVRFSSETYSVAESAGTATVTVSLSAPSDRTITVDYATSSGTADPGSDYAAANGTLTFEAGVTSRAFSVTILNDGQDEEDETIALTLSHPTNAVLGARFQAMLAIIDDDTTPPALPKVRLNEILPVPGEMDWDQDGTANELDEWIELYNAGTSAVDLDGWKLDDAQDAGTRYVLPASAALEPGAILVLYRHETGISLGDGGDTVRLLDASGQVVDTATFGQLGADTSYSRSEAGGWYVSLLPSPGGPNTAPLLGGKLE